MSSGKCRSTGESFQNTVGFYLGDNTQRQKIVEDQSTRRLVWIIWGVTMICKKTVCVYVVIYRSYMYVCIIVYI